MKEFVKCAADRAIRTMAQTVLALIGIRPSYMMANSPYTLPQFFSGCPHFFVACRVDKYRDFKRALEPMKKQRAETL